MSQNELEEKSRWLVSHAEILRCFLTTYFVLYHLVMKTVVPENNALTFAEHNGQRET